MKTTLEEQAKEIAVDIFFNHGPTKSAELILAFAKEVVNAKLEEVADMAIEYPFNEMKAVEVEIILSFKRKY